MGHVLNFRLPEKLEMKLKTVCARIDRPRSYVLRGALEMYLEEYEDYLIALGRLNDKDDPILNYDEAVAYLKKKD